jgi:hypothetical protein
MDKLNTKVERAKHHLTELKTEIKLFFDTKPYVVSSKRDSQTQNLIYYVASIQETPLKIANITGDVLQNLRSALDHLAYNLATSSGTAGNSHIYFPISDDVIKYEKSKVEKTQGMSQETINLIDSIMPYKDGNKVLWQLHRLNNVDKHRLLITVGSAFRSVDLGADMHQRMKDSFPSLDVPMISFFVKPADRMFPLKIGDELFIGGVGDKENDKMKFAFDIAFGEVDVINGEPLIETLQSMVDEIESIFLKFHYLIQK